MAMTGKEKKQALGLAIGFAIAVAVLFWMYWRGPIVAEAAEKRLRIDTLQAEVDSALGLLEEGMAEDLQGRIETYRANLILMRQLVPAGNELPQLIDDITARANLRGVEVISFSPQPPSEEEMFQVLRYQLGVIGGYDPIGEFLSDVASLTRIMVPYDISLQAVPARQLPANVFRDTTVAALQADLMIRTFVKLEGQDEAASGAGGGSR